MAGNRTVRSSILSRRMRRGVLRRRTNRLRTRPNVRKATPSTSTSIGGLVATGVRTLTSFLPGQAVVRPVVDFLLKSFGFVTALNLTGDTFTASLKPIGLSANIPLNFGNLMCECKNLGLQGVNAQGLPVLRTDFTTGRVVRMVVTAEPTAPITSRSGDWAMAIVPLKQVADKSILAAVEPNFEDLKNTPGAKYGPATRSLSVIWIPNVTRDSTAAMNQNFADYTGFAFLMLAYSQEARSSYGNFPPDTFSVRITIKTFAHFDERLPMTGFEQQSGASVLQPNAVKPKSLYSAYYKGSCINLSDEHVIDAGDHLRIVVRKDLHPTVFQRIVEIEDKELIKSYEDISM